MDTRDLRKCFGQFATGVAVVSWSDTAGHHGITVNSLTSVSVEPPLLLVSIARQARAHAGLCSRPFMVNILEAGQERLARHFAGHPDPELTIQWQQGRWGPYLAEGLATLACQPWRQYDGGDHTLYVGRVEEFWYRAAGTGLGYFRGQFLSIGEPTVQAAQ